MVRFEQATSEGNAVEKLKQEHFSRKAVIYIVSYLVYVKWGQRTNKRCSLHWFSSHECCSTKYD